MKRLISRIDGERLLVGVRYICPGYNLDSHEFKRLLKRAKNRYFAALEDGDSRKIAISSALMLIANDDLHLWNAAMNEAYKRRKRFSNR